MKKKTGYFFLKFFIRATIGMALIFIINKYVLPADSSINVGLNPMTFLTSGTLGIPGVCLLYNRLIHVLCLLTQVQYRPNQSLTRPVLNGLSVIYCNCSEPSKISKNRYKMLAFLRLFLKFYLADTPHRRNA